MAEPDSVTEAYRHCEALVRAHDKDHYLTSLFAPAERRRYLFALYAFALEIGRVKAAVTEPMTGVIRLQWWLEAVTGLRAAEAAASPVMIALQDAGQQTNVALAPLAAAIAARQGELEGTPASGEAAVLFVMAARFLGAEIGSVDDVAGAAAQAVDADDRQQARAAYVTFRARAATVPESALPAFLPVALVPLLLKNPGAPQWRRQIALARAAWFGFPKL
jgi:phytoene/squalene synthetase